MATLNLVLRSRTHAMRRSQKAYYLRRTGTRKLLVDLPLGVPRTLGTSTVASGTTSRVQTSISPG